jgi:hypothetical protein
MLSLWTGFIRPGIGTSCALFRKQQRNLCQHLQIQLIGCFMNTLLWSCCQNVRKATLLSSRASISKRPIV